MKDETRHKVKADFKQFVGTAKQAASEIGGEIGRKAEKLLDDAKAVQRQLIVSVRLDDESVRRLEQLLEAGICHTRSEAVAFLTREGIKARRDLFDKIDQKIEEIRRIREELRQQAF
jgi:Arc/MetJ-type ribon-helix-helix transcriptional regulator